MHLENTNHSLTFYSGLNKSLIRKSKCVNTKQFELELYSKNIDAIFDFNRPVAFATSNVVQMFTVLKNKLKAGIFDISTPHIQVYLKQDLSFDFQGYGFCVPETQKILKKEAPFETGSVFFEKENSIEALNERLDKSYQNHERSSSHYLAPFVHEFLHSAYINYIYQKYGYEGLCPYTAQKYSRKANNCGLKVMNLLQKLRFNEAENNIILDNLGKYAASSKNQYHEVFAETFTKMICNSLSDKDSMPIKNPMDELKNFPKEFLSIVQKLFV